MSAKTALLEAIAGQNRGILSTIDEKQVIVDAVSRLEQENPTHHPLQATDKLSGDWRLLYTTSDELLRIDRLPLYSLGQIYQCVRVTNACIYNVAEVNGLSPLSGLVSVVARYEPASDCRVNVKFERAIFGLKSLIGYQSPAAFVEKIEAGLTFRAIDFKIDNRDQSGWLEITYLDDDCRIGRGNQGSVFVLAKSSG